MAKIHDIIKDKALDQGQKKAALELYFRDLTFDSDRINAVNSGDEDGKTPLLLAVKAGYYSIVEYLVNSFGCARINVNKASARTLDGCYEGLTPVGWAIKNKRYDIAEYLLDKGAQYDFINNEEKYKLHIAVACGNNNAVETLIGSAPDLDKLLSERDSEGYTALEQACRYHHWEVAELILSNILNPNFLSRNKNDSVIHLIIPSKNSTILERRQVANLVEKMLEKDPKLLTIKDYRGFNLLMHMAREEAWKNVEVILEKDAPLANCVNSDGRHLIHMAAAAGDVGVVELLLKKDPSLIERMDKSGKTPLLHAAENGHLEMLKYFVAQGANLGATVQTKTSEGLIVRKNVLELAEENKREKELDELNKIKSYLSRECGLKSEVVDVQEEKSKRKITIGYIFEAFIRFFSRKKHINFEILPEKGPAKLDKETYDAIKHYMETLQGELNSPVIYPNEKRKIEKLSVMRGLLHQLRAEGDDVVNAKVSKGISQAILKSLLDNSEILKTDVLKGKRAKEVLSKIDPKLNESEKIIPKI